MPRPRQRTSAPRGPRPEQPLDVEVRMGQEVARVAAALREVDRTLPTHLRRELRKAAAVGVKRVKSEVRSMRVSGHAGSTGLRRRVARGVRARAGARTGMRITTSMPDSAQSIIPRGLDSRTRHRDGGWRHPVFGQSDVWVHQTGASWFIRPLLEERAAVAANVARVLDEAAARVAQAGE